MCHLNHTARCNDLVIVFFIKEEKNITKNVTVGNCFKDSVQTHHRLRFYFKESSIDGIDCIMDFSSSPSPRDNGRYHCVVWNLNAEKKELTFISSANGYEVIHADSEVPPIKSYYFLPVIVGFMLAIVFGTAMVIFVCRKRTVRHADMRGEITCSGSVDLCD